jgi:mono/diheme cytochrome c family protein
MRAKLVLFAMPAFAIVALATDQATLDAGRKAEQTGCVPCHSLRLVQSQRLARATWDRELTKMAGWGWTAKPEERAALLEYLVANFGDDKPVAPPEKSGDGRK